MLSQPVLILAGIGIGVSSSVIPYICDQLAMARLPRATFALMLTVLPATAAIVGFVVLAQIPALIEFAGIGSSQPGSAFISPFNNAVAPPLERRSGTHDLAKRANRRRTS